MKKIYILFLILCISVLLFSCAEPTDVGVDHSDENFVPVSMSIEDAREVIKNSNVQAYSLGNVVCDTESDTYIPGEISVPWMVPATADLHQDATAPETYTLTFESKEYTGTYQYSNYAVGSDHITHMYICGESIQFSIDGITGKMVDFYHSYRLGAPKLTRQECEKIVTEMAVAYIDIDDYQLTIQEYETSCIFKFEKYYRNVKTPEYLAMSISKANGDVYLLVTHMLGRFPSDSENTLSTSNSLQPIGDNYLLLATAKALTLSSKYTVLDSIGDPFWGMVDGKMMLFYPASLCTEEEQLSGIVNAQTFYIAVDTEGNLVTE